MNHDLYLSYSGRKTYISCPKLYEFRYNLNIPVYSDPRGSIFGSSIGLVFERFYKDKLWTKPDPVQALLDISTECFNTICKKEKFDPISDPPFKHEVINNMKKFIPNGVDTIKKYGFLTPFSQAEVDLSVTYRSEAHNMTLRIGGRADFIHSNDMRNVTLIDGKASKYRSKYVDSDQLIWYAVQHYLKYKVAPNKVGFLYWMFPNNPVDWISYDSKTMRDSLDATFEVAKKIKLKMFDAKPGGHCFQCSHRSVCDDGRKYLSEKKRESNVSIESSIFDLESVK